MAKTQKSSPSQTEKSGGESRGFMVAMLLLTLIAGASGFFFTRLVLLDGSSKSGAVDASMDASSKGGSGENAANTGDHGIGAHGGATEAQPAKGELVTLPPIVTNLAKPSETYIRLEGSLVVSPEFSSADVSSAKISEDIVAYLRTVSLGEIEGAWGFVHLRDDLNDRVRIRTEGKVREFIINSLVVE